MPATAWPLACSADRPRAQSRPPLSGPRWLRLQGGAGGPSSLGTGGGGDDGSAGLEGAADRKGLAQARERTTPTQRGKEVAPSASPPSPLAGREAPRHQTPGLGLPSPARELGVSRGAGPVTVYEPLRRRRRRRWPRESASAPGPECAPPRHDAHQALARQHPHRAGSGRRRNRSPSRGRGDGGP